MYYISVFLAIWYTWHKKQLKDNWTCLKLQQEPYALIVGPEARACRWQTFQPIVLSYRYKSKSTF